MINNAWARDNVCISLWKRHIENCVVMRNINIYLFSPFVKFLQWVWNNFYTDSIPIQIVYIFSCNMIIWHIIVQDCLISIHPCISDINLHCLIIIFFPSLGYILCKCLQKSYSWILSYSPMIPLIFWTIYFNNLFSAFMTGSIV